MFVGALGILSNIGPGWTIAIVIAVVVIVLAIFEHFYLTPQQSFNKSVGLPKNWDPPEYYGPERYVDKVGLTPKGIKIFANGFDKEDIPRYGRKYGYPDVEVRIIPEKVDEIWANIRKTLSTNPPSDLSTLSHAQRKAIGKLPDDYPIVNIWSTIRWSNGNKSYVAGITDSNKVFVTVFYVNVTIVGVRNWTRLLEWEFRNVALLAVGRPDLAS